MESLVDRALYSVNKRCNLLEIISLSCHFANYPEDELFKIAYDADNIKVIKYLPLSVEEKVKCYVNIAKKHNVNSSKYILKLLSSLLCRKDPDLVLKCLKYLEFDCERYDILCLIKDEFKRILGMNSFVLGNSFGDYDKIIKSIKNKQLLIKAYNEENLNMDVKLAIVMSLEDKLKVRYLYDFDLAEQLEIIKSFRSDELKKKYAMMKRYVDYQVEIISVIEDEEFVVAIFDLNKDINFRFKLITLIKNNTLKKRLIELLSPSAIKDALKSNDLSKKDIQKIKYEDNYTETIDPKITFGLELECCGGESYDFLLIENVLKTWKITADGSVCGGIEVISPILRFEKKSLQELKYVCNLLSRGEFYTDERCGGHIHFGFNYFDNPQEFNTFLRLYCAIEDLLFIISNKQGTITRDGVDNYAKKFRQMYNDNKSFVFYAENIKKLGRYVKIVRDIPRTRYYALNIKNIGNKEKNTIEFRMPNGEINFNEIILNIQLFAKLMEKSKELNRLLNYKRNDLNTKKILEKYRLLLDTDLSDDDKVKLLLEILFTNEEVQNKYLTRYYDNVKTSKVRDLRRSRFVENELL